MDYGGRYSGSNAIEIIPEASTDSWMPPPNDQSIWATEDDYRVWNPEPTSDSITNSNQSRGGSEQPPNKKSRGSSQADSQMNGSNSKSKVIGKMFFKTKLCCKFRAGTCPYITNCNFAHGMEELRPPPPNWQEIVAAHDEASEHREPREEHQIPILTSNNLVGEGQRSYKSRHCKKFYTEEGCPYGDMCTFLHDEQSKARESVAISLSPTVGGVGYGAGANGTSQKPSNWKTRICNKWEMTGYCPFGSKCHFAHGEAELHRYGGGIMEMDGRDTLSAAPVAKQSGSSAKALSDTVASNTSVLHPDIYHMGVPAQRSAVISQRPGQRPLQKWKGPDKISRIYGDWIDDIE
ncbi:zinc finger CCCH domain-containing protein 56-like [Iris pallida]|uniref:Zinc finger CCCH domain-containing protein 56-like n=1 Tax=Iris pallida TaxID=29817 RepID=A0AAX6DJZ1_IRIPA|nr:zinc finger CCCH domain-containing protein 56-like [Iris pallida]KAJ6792101.1 zinc finger CCCH domain-containing protein 56-like [Iris pallida]